jgi:hypothetical protein
MQKEKLKENWKLQKINKRSNHDHLFPSNDARKRGLLTINSCIKVRLDLQVDKSRVVFKGPLIPLYLARMSAMLSGNMTLLVEAIELHEEPCFPST